MLTLFFSCFVVKIGKRNNFFKNKLNTEEAAVHYTFNNTNLNKKLNLTFCFKYKLLYFYCQIK